jgi:hypothetical protein
VNVLAVEVASELTGPVVSTKMMLFILGSFYVTMAAAGYLTELIFGGLGLIPGGPGREQHAHAGH